MSKIAICIGVKGNDIFDFIQKSLSTNIFDLAYKKTHLSALEGIFF